MAFWIFAIVKICSKLWARCVIIACSNTTNPTTHNSTTTQHIPTGGYKTTRDVNGTLRNFKGLIGSPSLLKAPTKALTKNLLKHYAKQAIRDLLLELWYFANYVDSSGTTNRIIAALRLGSSQVERRGENDSSWWLSLEYFQQSSLMRRMTTTVKTLRLLLCW